MELTQLVRIAKKKKSFNISNIYNLKISFLSHLSSETHFDTELIVCGCTMLLFACDDSEDVAVFKVC